MRYWDVLVQALLEDPGLKLSDRALYLLIYERQPSSLREVEKLAGLSRTALRPACERLAAARWLRLDRAGSREDRWRPTPLVPAECQAKQVKCLQEESDMAANKGELLMKRQLDLRVRDRAYIDNARPPALQQPLSTHRLELDRLYLVGVGFEFCGFHHHTPKEGATEAETEAIRSTQTRDLVKLGLSQQAGIRLVRVTGVDLRPEALTKLIPECLPLRRIDPACLYSRELGRMCDAYASYAARAAREAAGQAR